LKPDETSSDSGKGVENRLAMPRNEGCWKVFRVEETCLEYFLGLRLQMTADKPSSEDSLVSAPGWAGVQANQPGELDDKTGLFAHLPHCRVGDRLAVVDAASWKAPDFEVLSLREEDQSLDLDDDSHSELRH
jgi:hypothetical protein